MTALLQQVFEKASALPDTVQDVLAKELLDELEWEKQWDQTLAGSQHLLEHLTLQAMHDYEHGDTQELGFDEL